MDYLICKLFGYDTGSVHIPQETRRSKMRPLRPYIRTIKGQGKRRRNKKCRRKKIAWLKLFQKDREVIIGREKFDEMINLREKYEMLF